MQKTVTRAVLEMTRKVCIEKMVASEVALIEQSVILANSLGCVKYEKSYPWKYRNETTYPNLDYESIGEIVNRLKKIFIDSAIDYVNVNNEKGEIMVIVKWG